MTQIKLDFDNIADPGVEYTRRTTVDQTVTTPDALKKCLVVQRGSVGAEERLTRIGSYAEVVDAPLPDLPALVGRFTSASFTMIGGGIQTGDVLHVTSPFLWRQHFGAPVTFVTTVNSVVSSTIVEVDTPFPAFGRNLEFYVMRAAAIILPTSGAGPYYPVDGLADRDYTATPAILQYLSADHADTWDDIDDANANETSVEIEAQSLVDATKEDNYTGQSSEVFV